MRAILMGCLILFSIAPAAAQTAEELVAFILSGTEAWQGPEGITVKRLSQSPAVLETSSGMFVRRLTVSTTDRCRYKLVEETRHKDVVEAVTATMDSDFSAAVPPVTIVQTGGEIRQSLVKIAGLKLTGCTIVGTPMSGVPLEVQREYERSTCDNFMKQGMPVGERYSAERATNALITLKTNFCK
jgi:hypothetical protein